jgi:TerC family integral membrane protein
LISFAKQLRGRGRSTGEDLRSGEVSQPRIPRVSVRRAGVVVASIAEEKTEEVDMSKIAFPLLASLSAAALFGFGVYTLQGPEAGFEFAAGFLVEQSLSVDNIFVFLLIFNYFKVPKDLEQIVLSWGIFGAIVLRALFIALGAVAINNFHQVLLIFAAFLLYCSYKLLVLGDDDEDEDLSNNKIVSTVQRFVPAVSEYNGSNFFAVTEDGRKAATPLLITLICIELSDIVFAVDSVPAVFGVTEDPFIVFSSNIFAILALRSLFQVLSVAVKELEYLEQAVAIVLGFVGIKLVGEYFGMDMPASTSVAVILAVLGGGVGLSLYRKDKDA